MHSKTTWCFLWLAVFGVGCKCTPPPTTSIAGEVRWEWQTNMGAMSDSSARVDFPTTSMGAHREQVLYVQNVGRAAFTMSEFAKLSGSAVTLGLLSESNAAFEVRWERNVVVNPTERQPVMIIFSPPIMENERISEYAAELEFRPSGAAPSTLTLTGRAIADECAVPELIDFGSVPIGTVLDSNIRLRNDSEVQVTASAGGVTGVPVGVFELGGLSNGKLVLAPGTMASAVVNFKPTEPKDYMGQFTLRRSEACPQRTVQVRGRGVTACLTWRAAPPEDSTATSLHFGNVAPGASGPGTITFSNACSLDISLSQIRTAAPAFVVTAAGMGDLTTLQVPASRRDASQSWVSGTAVTALEFRPMGLGGASSQLLATTTLPSQSNIAVGLRGFGGGPRIEVRPSPVLNVGRIGFTAGATPGTFAQRTLRIANVGNRPATGDDRANLHLGMMGQGQTYWTVRAITGTPDELCVGAWDAIANTCAGTLSAGEYNPTKGIEAVAGALLLLPLRVTPATAGQKEWELTVYSNDVQNPEVKVRITAEAIEAPPCNYSVAPTNLAFGIMNQPQVRDLSFTFQNLGTQMSEVCYINGLELSATSHATFTLQSTMSDFMLGAGQSQTVSVRAQPLQPAGTATVVMGQVQFGVSSPRAPLGTVALSATLAPACLAVAPSPAMFRDTELECGSPDRAIVITNNCAQSVTLNSTTLTNAANAPMGSGTCTTTGGCPQFVITSAPAMGPLAPGNSRTLLARFRPFVLGPATGELTINVQQGAQAVDYTVPLVGTGLARTMAGCGVSVVCPGPMTVNANSTVNLAPTIMASGSVSCNWSTSSRPVTSNGTFSAPMSCTGSSYFADVVGTHVVQFDVRDSLGGSAQCTTPITVTANGDLWIELTWDRDNDVDLHLLHSNAGSPTAPTSWFSFLWDCNYIRPSPVWGNPAQSPSLDRDDRVRQGPENIRINTPQPGIDYTVGIHMYNYVAANPVTSTVRVYCGGQLITTQTRTMDRIKDMWVVGNVRFGSASPCAFTPLNSVILVPG